jgi:hypothetical protein
LIEHLFSLNPHRGQSDWKLRVYPNLVKPGHDDQRGHGVRNSRLDERSDIRD